MDGIHVLYTVRKFDSGAEFYACHQCDFTCIIYNDTCIPIMRGDQSVYHLTPDEYKLSNIDLDVPSVMSFDMTHEIANDAVSAYKDYLQQYGDIVKTAFFDWIAEHREELENL